MLPTLAQEGTPLPEGSAPSSVPLAIQSVRWHMLDAEVNALTFRSMNQIFDTREVLHRMQTLEIPRCDKSLYFRYEFEGSSYTPDQFLDRTFTNAMIVIKDGNCLREVSQFFECTESLHGVVNDEVRCFDHGWDCSRRGPHRVA